jgi:hypothetical protein
VAAASRSVTQHETACRHAHAPTQQRKERAVIVQHWPSLSAVAVPATGVMARSMRCRGGCGAANPRQLRLSDQDSHLGPQLQHLAPPRDPQLRLLRQRGLNRGLHVLPRRLRAVAEVHAARKRRLLMSSPCCGRAFDVTTMLWNDWLPAPPPARPPTPIRRSCASARCKTQFVVNQVCHRVK